METKKTGSIVGVYVMAIFVAIIDQFVKYFISAKMALGESFYITKNFLYIHLVHNEGAAFNILEGETAILIGIAIVAIIFISLLLVADKDIIDSEVLTCGLLIGGIAGNAIDRIVHGYVIDYISINIGSYSFPIFNFADICIVIAFLILIFGTTKESVWK